MSPNLTQDKGLMAPCLQGRILGQEILGQVLPKDSKQQTRRHQTFNPGLGAWEALIFFGKHLWLSIKKVCI